MRYLLDTGVAADYINRRAGVYARARQALTEGARLGLCAPVLGELWDGVFFSATRGFNEALLNRHLSHFAIWPSTRWPPSNTAGWPPNCTGVDGRCSKLIFKSPPSR